MSHDAVFAEVRRVSALLAAHGRPDCRARLLDVLAAPLTDRDRIGVLSYEIGVLVEQPCPYGMLTELESLRGQLLIAAR